MSAPESFPLPPFELASRTGSINDASSFWKEWNEVGAAQAELIRAYLPAGWQEVPDRRILDFGCGSGRTLRQFADEAARWEVWGCDIDEPSIAWLQTHLDPPFHFFHVSDEPHLPQPDESFDFFWAFSVFTHITSQWSGWLLELHRCLKPGGIALVSFLGRGMIGPLVGEEWNSDVIGMNVLRVSQSWDIGGPIVFHSEWWIRAHWGRLFNILRLDDAPEGHGLALLEKRPIQLTNEDLIAPEPDEPREYAALAHNIEQLHMEEGRLRESLSSAQAAYNEQVGLREQAERAYSEQISLRQQAESAYNMLRGQLEKQGTGAASSAELLQDATRLLKRTGRSAKAWVNTALSSGRR